MSVLSDKQARHVKFTALLILYIYERGYTAAWSFAKRCDECTVGKDKSLHKIKLAIDLDLFKDGKYLTKTKDYEFAGVFWESLDPSCEWGGSDGRDDGCHFSISHNGRW